MTIDKKKIAGIALAVLAGLGAAGLIIWRPWSQAEPEVQEPPAQRVEEDQPLQVPEEKGPALTVGGKEIACTVCEGDGWSIWVPEGWELEERTSGATLWPDRAGKADASLTVTTEGKSGLYSGNFVSVFPTGGADRVISRLFYHGGSDHTGEVWTQAADRDWEDLGPVMAAVAGTYAVGEERPFEGWRPLAKEPQWQKDDGLTVLFMDKDGFIVDNDAQKAAAAFFSGLEEDVTGHLTGNLRLEELTWAGSYEGLIKEQKVDVFSVWPEAEIKTGEESEISLDGGADIRGGWYRPGQRLDIAVVNNGEWIKGAYMMTSAGAVGLPGWAEEFGSVDLDKGAISPRLPMPS